MARFRDDRIDYPDWATDLASYREFYNRPKWSNYVMPDESPLIYPRLEFAKLFARGKVLDVGCNGGKFDFDLARRGLSVLGIDISEFYVGENERRRASENPEVRGRLEFRAQAAEEIEYRDEFDAVMIFELLEHLLDPIDVIRRCVRALRPNGVGLITVPLAGGPWERHTEGDNEHLRAFTPDGLKALLDDTTVRSAAWAHPGRYGFGVFFGSNHHAAVEAIVRIRPSGVMAYHHLVDCLESIGEYQACQDVAADFVQRAPHDRSARFRLALHLYRVGQADRALQTIGPLVGDCGCRTRSFFRLLAQILAACGRSGESTQAMSYAVELPADDSDWAAVLWQV